MYVSQTCCVHITDNCWTWWCCLCWQIEELHKELVKQRKLVESERKLVCLTNMLCAYHRQLMELVGLLSENLKFLKHWPTATVNVYWLCGDKAHYHLAYLARSIYKLPMSQALRQLHFVCVEGGGNQKNWKHSEGTGQHSEGNGCKRYVSYVLSQ